MNINNQPNRVFARPYNERYLPTAFDSTLSLLEKINLLKKEIDNVFIDRDAIYAELDTKESKQDLAENRKLSPNGDFTGTLKGRPILEIIAELDETQFKLQYLIGQFSRGQTGWLIDGGYFDNASIKFQYNGGDF